MHRISKHSATCHRGCRRRGDGYQIQLTIRGHAISSSIYFFGGGGVTTAVTGDHNRLPMISRGSAINGRNREAKRCNDERNEAAASDDMTKHSFHAEPKRGGSGARDIPDCQRIVALTAGVLATPAVSINCGQYRAAAWKCQGVRGANCRANSRNPVNPVKNKPVVHS